MREIEALRRWCGRLPAPVVSGWYWARTRLLGGYSDASPTKLLWVDPAEIRYTEGRGGQCRIGIVMDGAWDRTPKLLMDDQRYADIQEIYRGALENGGRLDRQHSLSPRSMSKLDYLFDSFTRYGYLTQRELRKINRSETSRLNNDVIHPIFNEIGVNIYMDGTLVRTGGGFHRLALATALDIPAVPVIVRVRHAQWQALRREVREASSVNALGAFAVANLRHPDLADVVPRSWLMDAPQRNSPGDR